MIDRRFDLRVPLADTVNLSWTDPAGQKQDVPADLADISRSGASMRTQRPVKLRTMLTLNYQDQNLLGKVTYCTSEASGYILGIEFEDGHQWFARARG